MTTSSNSTTQNPQTTFTNNSVFIDQVGTGNVAEATVISNSSQVAITQDGDFNEARLFLNALNIDQTVLQVGNNNSFSDFINSGAPDHGGTFIQQGNNNSIIRHNTNSISQRINILQTGNQNIEIRNF